MFAVNHAATALLIKKKYAGRNIQQEGEIHRPCMRWFGVLIKFPGSNSGTVGSSESSQLKM